MKLPLQRNILSVVVAILLSTGLSLLLNSFTNLRTSSFIYSLLFYAVLFVVFNVFYAYYRGHESFVSLLLGGIVVRLLLTLILIVICKVTGMEEFFPFTMHLIGHYILFTVIEIRYLHTIIQSNRS